ncbi:hypothetical protein DIJ64_06400 [Mycobacterium leprae]|uniref:Cytochrome P450 n=1 Tax=Mycobacterium leprae TaxID=1769 RepID=A0AAD0KW62_MYCLR|nr:hypothetical protein DIJ64_06400 [Mycobacterium leprae]
MGSANRDGSRWTEPNTFDIHWPRQAHTTLAGSHMCLGIGLAQLDTRVMLNNLFDRITKSRPLLATMERIKSPELSG